MNRFGYVVYPEDSRAIRAYAFARIENGVCLNHNIDLDDVSHGIDYPQTAFYSSAEIRDAEMLETARRFPNLMFCPIEVTAGTKFPVSKTPSKLQISDRGITPA
jgi:hypothetical protein